MKKTNLVLGFMLIMLLALSTSLAADYITYTVNVGDVYADVNYNEDGYEEMNWKIRFHHSGNSYGSWSQFYDANYYNTGRTYSRSQSSLASGTTSDAGFTMYFNMEGWEEDGDDLGVNNVYNSSDDDDYALNTNTSWTFSSISRNSTTMKQPTINHYYPYGSYHNLYRFDIYIWWNWVVPVNPSFSISSVGTTSLRINKTSDNNYRITDWDYQVSTNSSFTNVVSSGTEITGTYTDVSGLSPGTTYYVRIRGENEAGTGSYTSYTTTTTSTTTPTVSTNSPSSVTYYSAVLGGNVSADGGATVSTRGVCWNTSGSPTTSNSYNSNGSGTGSFSETTSSFNASQLYYVRAYATNSAGTGYGSTYSFKTLPTAATNIFPDDDSTVMPQTVTLSWRYNAGSGGTPDGFKVYKGDVQQGSNIVYTSDILYNYQLSGQTWGASVNWEIVPYNATGNCASPTEWNYTVMSEPANPEEEPAEVVYTEEADYSGSDPSQLTLPVINFGNGNVNPTLDFGYDSSVSNFNVYAEVSDQPNNPVAIPENCGAAFRSNFPSGIATSVSFGFGGGQTPDQLMHWNGSAWEDITATSGASFGAGTVSFSWTSVARGEEEFVVNNGDGALPVNLSFFYARYIGGTPTVYWVTQTETDNEYWNVYRGNNNNFTEALHLNANTPVPGNGTTNIASEYVYVDINPIIQNTSYWYWIEDVSTDGETEVHHPITLFIPYEDTENAPVIFGLHQNYPNPFNPSTSISFTLSEESDVELIIYNVKGAKINTIFNDHIYADQVTTAVWDGNDINGKQVSSGVYLYKLITNTRIYSKKMLMMK